jgi:branched-chain amino acid aminotransferase/para-aminobenzoate synthetase component 1
MRGAEKGADRVVWLNDGFLSLEDARISPMDRGFLYGDGLFETMRAQDGRALRLARHLERLRAGLASLRIRLEGVSESAWAPIITALLVKNGLAGRVASVKAVVSRGAARGIGLPEASTPTVLLAAEAYEPPPPAAFRKGWQLHGTAAGHAPGIARHKTLNYLRMLAARQEAMDAGADEALLVDTEGFVIETAAGSVLALTRDGWVRPAHDGQLTGITVETVTRMLENRGHRVVPRRMPLAELKACRAAWVLNSLIGIMPVRCIDDIPLPETAVDMSDELRRELFAAPR